MRLPDGNQHLWRRGTFVSTLVLLLQAVRCACFAEGGMQQYIARSWSSDDGLPHNYILAVLQSQDGYLWVGTRSGLARFDGVRFTPIDWAPIKGAQIGSLCEARDGSLWIALEGHGLLRWSEQGVAHYGPTNGLKSNFVRALCEGKDGSIWIASRGGLTRYHEGNFLTFTRADGLAGPLVEAVCEDPGGNLWAGTSEGLNCLKDEKVTATLTTRDGLPGNSITALCDDRKGNLWIGTSEGLAVLSAGRIQTPYHEANGLPERFIRTLYEDRRGNLWIGTYGGLYRAVTEPSPATASPSHGPCVPQANAEGAAYDRVMSIIQDREGSIWVGSRDGLSRLRVRPFAGLGKSQGLSQNSATSVCEDTSGALWVTTWRGGLDCLQDGKLCAYSATNGLATDLLLSLCPSHNGGVWIGADHAGGLYRFKDGGFNHYDARDGLTNIAIQVICEDTQTNLWIGTPKTLTLFKGGKFTDFTPHDGLVGEVVRAILEDHAGNLWIGTATGLSCRRNGRFVNFTTQNGLSYNSVTALYEDGETNLWIGTAGGGLTRFRDDHFTAYTTHEGLFSDDLLEILEDDFGCLWISCPNGVFRVEKKSLDDFDAGKVESISCATFGKDEGMVGVQCTGAGKPAGWKGRDGRLWFTTIKGLAVAQPNIRSNVRPPPVVIEEVLGDKRTIASAMAQPVQAGNAPPLQALSLRASVSPVRIPPGHGELEIHYTALSFQAPEKNRFKYKLEGVDADWVDAGPRRVAYYNKVYPGHYEFRVVACNNDGVWNEEGASIALMLMPHVWQTWWFLFLALVAAVGAVGGTAAYWARRASRLRLARLEQQHALEQERTRIARDIHDDLGSRLTHISMLSELAEADKASPKEVETHVRKIAASARETVRSLDEIVWAVSPEHDTWNSLVGYLSEYANEFFAGTQVRCRLEMPMDLPSLPLPSEVRHSLFLVIKEALNNSLKHAGASEVRIRVSQDDSLVEIAITDDGRGFDLDQAGAASSSGGLRNMRERVESLRGRLRIETARGKGTRLTVAVPLEANTQVPPPRPDADL
jgi:ligand-binding sensor domain-containing protein/signal transduction histidine kinase